MRLETQHGPFDDVCSTPLNRRIQCHVLSRISSHTIASIQIGQITAAPTQCGHIALCPCAFELGSPCNSECLESFSKYERINFCASAKLKPV